MNRSILSDLYQEIKHKNRLLSEEEIQGLILVIGSNYNKDNDLFSIAILCLGLGSDFIKARPDYFKDFFSSNIIDEDLVEIFRCIQYNQIIGNYIFELLEYSTVEKYLNEYELASIEALNAIGEFLYNSRNNSLYYIIRNRLKYSLSKYLETKDQYVKVYIKAIYKCLIISFKGHQSKFESNEINYSQDIMTNLPEKI